MKFKNTAFFIVLVLSILLVLSFTKRKSQKELYKNPKASIENRVSDLLKKMTLEEKIAQLSEAGCDDMKEDNNVKTTKFPEKLPT